MIITVISPDKLTLSMFSDFFKSLYSLNTVPIIKDINSLFSLEYQESLFKSLSSSLNKDESLIIRYKIKNRLNKNIPQEIFNGSGYVLYLDMLHVIPVILKALNIEWFKTVVTRWETNIKKLSG